MDNSSNSHSFGEMARRSATSFSQHSSASVPVSLSSLSREGDDEASLRSSTKRAFVPRSPRLAASRMTRRSEDSDVEEGEQLPLSHSDPRRGSIMSNAVSIHDFVDERVRSISEASNVAPAVVNDPPQASNRSTLSQSSRPSLDLSGPPPSPMDARSTQSVKSSTSSTRPKLEARRERNFDTRRRVSPINTALAAEYDWEALNGTMSPTGSRSRPFEDKGVPKERDKGKEPSIPQDRRHSLHRSLTGHPPDTPTTGLNSKDTAWSSTIVVWAKIRSFPAIDIPTANKSSEGETNTKVSTSLRSAIPAAVRKRVSRRESTHTLQMTSAFGISGRSTFGKAPSASLSTSFTYSATGPNSATWAWRRAECTVNTRGLLTITTIDDRIPIHSIPMSLLSRSDIRLIDQSLLSRSNCLAINISSTRPQSESRSGFEGMVRSPSFRPSTATGFLHFNGKHDLSSAPQPPCAETEDFCYIGCSSVAELHGLYVLLKSHAMPFDVTLLPLERRDASAETAAETPFRMWRSLELTIIDGRGFDEKPVDTAMTTSLDESVPTPRHGPSILASSFTARHKEARSSEKEEKPSHRGPLQFFCEVSLDDVVQGRTAIKKGSGNPFWRETFAFRDLATLNQTLEVRIYGIAQRKVSLDVTLKGIAHVPLSSFRRNDTVEQWFPVFNRPLSQIVGDVHLQIRVSELPLLPLDQYADMTRLLEKNASLIYQIVTSSAHDLESISEVLLRVFLAMDLFQTRIEYMLDTEIHGKEGTASILFRGNTVLTKMLEVYLRMAGAEFLIASIGEAVNLVCAQRVEVEIDPAKLKAGNKERSLTDNVHDLTRWTSFVWNALYQARHKCPNELRHIFKFIRRTVAKRYPEQAGAMQVTGVSAFLFLRFFVPALLNPKVFGLTTYHPEPSCQRTLTLIAKTLQGLANMATFGSKESFMTEMNPFLEEASPAFIDYMTFISRPARDLATQWTSSEYHLYKPANLRLEFLPDVSSREALPQLPFLLDLPRDLTLLAMYTSRNKALHIKAPGSTEPSDLQLFEEACQRVTEEGQERWRTLLQMPSDEEAHADETATTFVFGPQTVQEAVYETPSTSFSLRNLSPSRRNRAQTVSGANATGRFQIRRTPSTDLSNYHHQHHHSVIGSSQPIMIKSTTFDSADVLSDLNTTDVSDHQHPTLAGVILQRSVSSTTSPLSSIEQHEYYDQQHESRVSFDQSDTVFGNNNREGSPGASHLHDYHDRTVLSSSRIDVASGRGGGRRKGMVW